MRQSRFSLDPVIYLPPANTHLGRNPKVSMFKEKAKPVTERKPSRFDGDYYQTYLKDT